MPDRIKKKELARQRRKKHIKKKVQGTSDKPRLIVRRSLNHIYAQIIDDFNGKTLITASSQTKDIVAELAKVKGKCEKSKLVGKWLAQAAVKKNISKVVFDRSGYLYHGRIKALADGAREGGLEF